MRYPNLRYGNPQALQYYAAGMTPADLARRLRRDERTVRDWLAGRSRVPWWVPEILRLQQLEHQQIMRQHMQFVPGYMVRGRPLAVVTHEGQLELRRHGDVQRHANEKKAQAITALRLSDFDPPITSSVS